jgi:hypothetical protein
MAGMPENRLYPKEYFLGIGARKNFNRRLEWQNENIVNAAAWIVG